MIQKLASSMILICIAFVYILDANAQDTFTIKQIKQDFSHLYERLAAAQYDLYHHTSKEDYDRAFTEMKNTFTRPMTKLELQKTFQQFVARAQIAHTRIDFPLSDYRSFMQNGGKTLPVYPTITATHVLVDEFYGSERALTSGVEIIKINGTPIREWLQPIYSYLSADNDEILWGFVGQQLPALLWLHEGEKESYELTIKDLEGKQTKLIVATQTSAQQEQNALTNSDDSESDTLPREYKMLDNNIAYLKPGPFYNFDGEDIWDTTSFHQFIDDAFEHFASKESQNLIIDLRNNPGGTNSFSDHMLAWFADEPFKFASDFKVKISPESTAANAKRLKTSKNKSDVSHQLAEFYSRQENGTVFSFPLPTSAPHPDKHFDGNVYVLINRFSYSNAVSVAAIAKDYGFATVIGEKTADLATTHGAMERFTLPNTGIEVGYPKALIIRPNGDTRPDGVTPDIWLDFAKESADAVEQAVELISLTKSLANIKD